MLMMGLDNSQLGTHLGLSYSLVLADFGHVIFSCNSSKSAVAFGGVVDAGGGPGADVGAEARCAQRQGGACHEAAASHSRGIATLPPVVSLLSRPMGSLTFMTISSSLSMLQPCSLLICAPCHQ